MLRIGFSAVVLLSVVAGLVLAGVGLSRGETGLVVIGAVWALFGLLCSVSVAKLWSR
ncbi:MULTISPECIES: hypothetical protein [Kocuria]|uniref:Major facilitator superfamily (MFS) profile domain-containing protein n=1 Tax=Kocuria flava TaxID=446860 RepID=A0ABQ0X208_9MICC|nr:MULTISPECIES: hypothetical protein [Kocuria]MCD1145301.1 hypothetical protein [Kocuria sp. LUK]GEO91672.1 hypothetical protein KFL01_09780 [Kocuria flava]